MIRTSAICLLAVAILPYLVLAQDDNTGDDGISDWNTTGLKDDLLIGIIAGSVALFLVLTLVCCICSFCFLCPGMCGGYCCGGRQDYYNEPQPYIDPPISHLPEPIPLPAPPPAQYYPPELPEPVPQLPVVLSRPPPVQVQQEPTYIVREPPQERREVIVREREPERRERVAYVVRGEGRGRYESDSRRVVIASRGGRYDDDRRVRYVSSGSDRGVDNYAYRSSRTYYDSPRRLERSDYY